MVLNSKEIIKAVINSAKRLNPTTETGSNFTVTFNRDVKRIVEIALEAVQIPYSFYTINSSNNVLSFNKGAISITIPAGNYTTSNLTSLLKTLINTAFNDTTTSVTIAYSNLIMSITRGTTFNVDAMVDYPISTAANMLGYGISTPTALTSIGNNAVNISGPNYILVRSTLLTKAISHQMLYSDNSYSNVLLSVPVCISPGGIINLNDKVSIPIKYSYKFDILAGTPIDIKITDEFGNILSMNGSDISIQFAFITE